MQNAVPSSTTARCEIDPTGMRRVSSVSEGEAVGVNLTNVEASKSYKAVNCGLIFGRLSLETGASVMFPQYVPLRK